jgi:hypothetical protein
VGQSVGWIESSKTHHPLTLLAKVNYQMPMPENRRHSMNDDTRKLLKVFGVAVTDSEAEAEKLAGIAAQLSTGSRREDLAQLLKDSAELCRELSTRWREITERVLEIQNRLQTQLIEAAKRLQGTK